MSKLRRWWHRTAAARDRGAATVFVIGVSLVLFGVAGLAIDGGKVINIKDQAHDVAEQAARAGANQIALGPLRDQGVVVLDQAAAHGAAAAFVGAHSGYELKGISSTATTVTVEVTTTVTTNVLGLVGVTSIPVEGSATASPVTGINAGVVPP